MNADARAPATAAARVRLRDVCELAKPRLTLMVVLTTVVGAWAAASGAAPDAALLLHVAAGTLLTAAGASALNQLLERRPDGCMVRTADRPLPAGRMAPRDALILGATGAAVGVVYLALVVNALTALLAGVTLATYLALYTPLKRVTPHCTLVGAAPGAIPVLMGWTAVTNRLDPEALVLFGVLFWWQLPHFMAIAVLYVDDYARAGFPMWPVVDRRRSAAAPGGHANRTGAYAVAGALLTLAVSLAPLAQGRMGLGAGLIVLAAGAVYVGGALRLATAGSRPAARALFIISLAYLPLTLGVLAGAANRLAP